MENETERLLALQDYRLLDTRPEAMLDEIAQLASKIFSVPIVLVSLIDTNRQWFKAKVGLEETELAREDAFCNHAIRDLTPMIVADALLDPRFANNPLVTGSPGIRFYCGVALRTPQGNGLGALCLIDRVPRAIDAAGVESLVRLARLVENEFEVHRRLLLVENTLKTVGDSQHAKQLMASMVVHDLRSPLTAIGLLAGALADERPESGALTAEMLEAIETMQHMLTDILDITLGEAGQLRIRPRSIVIGPLLGRLSASWVRLAAQKRQNVVIDLPDPSAQLFADPELLERVLSNLVRNAIQYGPAGQSISVKLESLSGSGHRFEVIDQCQPIPNAAAEAIFRPFERLEPATRSEGRGLGLAFCRLAILAHGGKIGVMPQAGGNRFFFEISEAQKPASPGTGR